jgi:UPF0755 protein
METSDKSKKRIQTILLGILGFALVAFLITKSLFFGGFDIEKTTYLYIDDRKDYKQLIKDLDDSAHINGLWLFKSLSSSLGYPQKMKAGRYIIHPKDGILTVFRRLRNGSQTPVKLTFNNIRTKKELIDKIGPQFMFGTKGLSVLLNDTARYHEWGLDTNTVVCLFIPDTYEMYWNVKPDAFLKKMEKAYGRFWTESRIAKLAEIGLSKPQAMTLASIVEEECRFADEYPMVAGLYLNRLHSGQPLQADPTVKFAVNDFTLRRILLEHLKVNSPYNTYIHPGLPPGPIRIPSTKAIDGVLNYTHHDYLYMCAKDDFSGRHNFATSFAEHRMNAQKYQKALNKRNIMN